MSKLPFKKGQTVIAVDAVEGSVFKNGKLYIVRVCTQEMNPSNGLGPFMYVGVEDHEGNHYRPGIFRVWKKGRKYGKFTFRIPRKLKKEAKKAYFPGKQKYGRLYCTDGGSCHGGNWVICEKEVDNE